MTTSSIDVAVDDRQTAVAIDGARWAGLLAAALSDEGAPQPAEVGLTFVELSEMADLNSDHMGVDGPTDVLAFPIDGRSAAPVGQPAMLGDIVICPEYAKRAPQSLDDELALLVVHGALHLLGHDHAEPVETQLMKRREQELLATHFQDA